MDGFHKWLVGYVQRQKTPNLTKNFSNIKLLNNVADPEVFGPPGSGSLSTRYGSGYESFYHQAKIVRKILIA
jgi:hypothetical protein